jgi:tripartite-type tricarboxylate transporter receptor subunit TctC
MCVTTEVPGIGEFVPGYRAAFWHGMFLPRGVPPAVIARLRAEINAVLAMPEVRDKLVSGGAGEPYISTPEDFAAQLRADHARYGELIKSIGFKAD